MINHLLAYLHYSRQFSLEFFCFYLYLLICFIEKEQYTKFVFAPKWSFVFCYLVTYSLEFAVGWVALAF